MLICFDEWNSFNVKNLAKNYQLLNESLYKVMSIDLSQFIPAFLEESFEGLTLMESNLLALTQASDSETINAIFRVAHSIKGGAGTFGFEQITEFTHLVETLLDEIRDGRRLITTEHVELLLTSVDCIRLLLNAVSDAPLSNNASLDNTSSNHLIIDNDKIIQTSQKLTKILVEKVIDNPSTLPAVNEQIAINDVKAETKSITAFSSEASEQVQFQSHNADTNSIRVGIDKVDSLINLVGELVITQSMLTELSQNFQLPQAQSSQIEASTIEQLNSGLEQLLQNTKEIQESVMSIRMLPINFVFNRLPRLVHDLSKQTNKDVELTIQGEHTELDKTVMEQIGDPLIHLVRNAVDHGIESSEIRVANGKAAKGTITLNAYHQGGSIVIEISDDGAGINRQTIIDKALEKGLITSSAVLTEQQVYDLLFEAGFSTASVVSDISGRGVGMDVVKKNIQSLGGRVQVTSVLGQGTSFIIHLPLTLAIVDGQSVKVGSETYIIPLIAIVESLQVKAELVNCVSGDITLYRLREDNIPIIPLHQLFNIPAECHDVDQALLVVIEANGEKIGLMVDDLLAQQQVVIKNLADNYQKVKGISGATILGNGTVAMILDVSEIINLSMGISQYKSTANQVDYSEVNT